MLVRAKEMGFHGCRRRPGDVFEVPATCKGSWFEPVETVSVDVDIEQIEPAKRGRKPKSKDFEPQTFSEIAQTDGDAQYPNVNE